MDMMKLKRVGAPVPSPDGKWIVFDTIDADPDPLIGTPFTFVAHQTNRALFCR
jgi:hypothetical protein